LDELNTLLEELNDPAKPLRSALVYRLSDITLEDLAVLTAAWPTITVEQRRKLMRRLVETSEAAFDVDFATVARLGLEDPDADVRTSAVKALWTDESLKALRLLVKIMREDPDSDVRAAAAQQLGKFVLKGSLGELNKQAAAEAEKALFEVHQTADSQEVKRRTLESLAYSEGEKVLPLISEALAQENVKMRASALCAMGRNADERWHTDILVALKDDEPELRYEAARATGEVELREALPRLIELAHEYDYEVKMAAIWALGEIGGSEAQATLERLSAQEDDPVTLEAIEDALNMAMLVNGEFGGVILSEADLDEQFEAFFDTDDEEYNGA
jgi:HEAT repeat protein